MQVAFLNPLSHRCAMPALPRGEFFAYDRSMEKTSPVRERWICEAKTERVLSFNFFLRPVLQRFQQRILVQQLLSG